MRWEASLVFSSSFGKVSTTLRPVLPVAPTMSTVGAMEVVGKKFWRQMECRRIACDYSSYVLLSSQSIMLISNISKSPPALKGYFSCNHWMASAFKTFIGAHVTLEQQE
jgi:hypothetical protein